VAALLGAVASPVFAAGDLTKTSDGYTYFNRPGADRPAHDAAVRQCRAIASQLHQPAPTGPGTSVVMPAGVSPVAGGVGAAIGIAIAMAIQQSIADHKGQPVNVENCMVTMGWRVVALDETEGKAIVALKPEEKSAQLASWIGAEAPHGAVVRTFANDAAIADQQQLFAPAKHLGVAVSADLVTKPKGKETPAAQPLPAYAPRPAVKPPKMAAAAKPPKPLTDAELGGVPADSGLIVVNVRGDAEVAVTLQRIGSDPAMPAWVDGRPGEITVARPPKAYAKAGAAEGTTYVYAVPPGRWRLESVSVNYVPLSFCLGGPAFDLAAGEAVYAGSFEPKRVVPDMALEPAKAAIPALSPVAEKLRPANWVNGTQAQCRGTYLYALELPDRPYVDGYALGTHAQALSVAAPAPPAPAASPVTPAGDH